ncbi:MAG: PQQ-binding-like beta-propeller repeat protein [Polyangiales bacterium]
MPRDRAPLLLLLAALASCADDPPATPPPDAANDAPDEPRADADQPDASGDDVRDDLAADAAPDTVAPDAAPDIAPPPDAASDAPRPDAAPDVAPPLDAPRPDAAADAAPDAPRPDAAPDVAPPLDAAPDAPRPDAALDAAPDVVRVDAAPDAAPDVVTPPSGNAVTSFLNDPQRAGGYRAETRLTPAALRGGRLARDAAFNPTFDGPLYSQPLYVPGLTVGGARRDVLFVATEANSLYAVDADTGAQLWRTALGPTVARTQQSCGNITTIGVTSTPVIDLASRTLYAVSFNSEATLRFKLHALDLVTGAERAGYPAVIAAPDSNGSTFDARVTGQRGALALRDGRVYVPFGGLYGDCGIYHGWVVGIDVATPSRQTSFATPGRGSGIWAPAGISMDASGRIFAATGNSTPLGGSTPGSLGEFVLRFASGASGPTLALADTAGQFSPADARNLDQQDLDIGSVAPVVLPVGAGASPLLLQGGKAGTAYLLDANNLGAGEVFSARLCTGGVFGAMSAWTNGTDTYAFVPARGTRSGCSGSNGVVALRVTTTGASRGFATAWCSASVAGANPPVVSSNGNADAVLWVLGANTSGGTAALRAYEVSTGMEVYANTEPPPSVRQWVPPVIADGRLFVTGAMSVALYRVR